MRTIGVVTGARADYGIYRPILRRIREERELRAVVIVTGAHLSPEFGLTVREIEADGFGIGDRVEMLLSSDSPEGIAKSLGLGAIGFAQVFGRFRPDILLVLGDRFEMLAAVGAALPFKIPVAHIHGGESTEGAIDESIRHAVTKMSHLHFVSTEHYARRVMQMGEEPWRVVVSGAPSLDGLRGFEPLSRETFSARYGVDVEGRPLLVTYHSVTLEYEETEAQVRELLAALREAPRPIIFTYPNADTASRVIIEAIKAFAREDARAQVVASLGTEGYWSLMTYAAAMVGNSSSGLVEAASFELPVVNIGSRQRGRVFGENVINVEGRCADILAGIRRAIAPEFRARLRGIRNPYGDGQAAERIVSTLRNVAIDAKLLVKKFHARDREGEGERGGG
ncbi:MAG: UDP-N-acetylglucosamine 2-epimerase (hydrolyzing) [Candidatus Rokubacteria bacterium]|nr:UDP-N-acetylglucosamine 2-epimerase (hydrolyzing) [Candidatus Rokubacteria bacterium]